MRVVLERKRYVLSFRARTCWLPVVTYIVWCARRWDRHARAHAHHQLTYPSNATARVRFDGAMWHPTTSCGREGDQTEKERETFTVRPSLYTPHTHMRWCRQESFLGVRLRHINVTPVVACERNNNNMGIPVYTRAEAGVGGGVVLWGSHILRGRVGVVGSARLADAWVAAATDAGAGDRHRRARFRRQWRCSRAPPVESIPPPRPIHRFSTARRRGAVITSHYHHYSHGICVQVYVCVSNI